ncbi:hypothetical protein ES332_A12G249500v1 [Gossypium tomentosum]|uniref:Uncharacterized protein n=1 Tax=Gossypium tomentosum TaxID=34277 RepID=A0A5D2N128_GOSTO|nr:hypothetical protein ES332_A12G249500v1 [Gossypium tomentosum]
MKSTITDRSNINMLIWKVKLLVTEFLAYSSPWEQSCSLYDKGRLSPTVILGGFRMVPSPFTCGACGVVTCWTGDFSTIMMVEGTNTSDLGNWQWCD